MVELGLLVIFFVCRIEGIGESNEWVVCCCCCCCCCPLKLYGSLCEVVIPLLDSDDANLGETCAF